VCLKGWLRGRAALPRVHFVCLASWRNFGARAAQDPKQVGAGSPRTPEITIAGEPGSVEAAGWLMGSVGSPSSISPPADEGKPVESVRLVDQWPMGSVGSPSSISPPADEGKPVESVRLVDQLRQLPEAFGRIQGLCMLDISRN
jgi:hypothetical protein